MLAVLLFELLSYLNSYYYVMFALIEVLVLLFKWSSFSWYPISNLAMELAIQVSLTKSCSFYALNNFLLLTCISGSIRNN